ncbi:MAG: hypothetical protein NWF07_07590 [Candidatus Bathyarchaeota archaeon]|nr:hypothetical protein [Candidatus Bathyarchaeota archaeon]
MKTKKQSIIVLAFILTIMLGTIPTYAADSPILQVSASNIYLKGGQENQIKIVLKNTGDYKIYDIEAVLSSSISGITVISKANQVVAEIEAHRQTSYEPVIYIDQNLPLGAYSLSLSVSYGRTGAALQGIVTVPIGVIVSEAFTPSLVYSPTLEDIEVKAGAINDVSFKFINIDNETINDVKVVLTSLTNSITITNNIVTSVDELGSGESFTVNPTISIIEGTTLGTYSVTAIASYKDIDGNRFHQSFSLPINVASSAAVRTTLVTIEEMKVLEDSILPGDIFTVELTIECTGAVAYDLLGTLSFSTSSPVSPISPSVINLGDLGVGESTKATYSLLVSGSTAAGQYPITATITYTSSRGTSKSITETMTLLVDGLIDFEFLDVPSETASAGETKELEADLLLIGTESVEFVSIGVVEDDVIKRVSGSDEYIGAVDPDSPIPFDINYKVDSDAPEGEHELRLSVKYRDHLNREHEEQIGLDITIGEQLDDTPEPQDGGFWVWIRRLFGLGP